MKKKETVKMQLHRKSKGDEYSSQPVPQVFDPELDLFYNY